MPSTRAFLRWRDLREWSLFLTRLRSSFSSGVNAFSSSLYRCKSGEGRQLEGINKNGAEELKKWTTGCMGPTGATGGRKKVVGKK